MGSIGALKTIVGANSSREIASGVSIPRLERGERILSSMERLSCTSTVSYNATEAAIHMARYQLAVPYCKGKSVLDVACGEGYGAFALRQLGAASVDGVDNSPEAVKNAKTLFSKPGIQFHLHDAERIDELFPDQRFDVIVCLETIEHLKDPTRFLRVLQKVAAENATIIISCPNDQWYYAEG